MSVAEARPLYLIRHGQTEWNVEKRLQGGRDSPLTVLGRQQAEALARSLAGASLVRLDASPLGRASATARIIATILDIPLEQDPRLGEMRFGDAEGLTWDQIDRQWPGFRAQRARDKWHVRWPGGENYQDVDRRIAAFVADKLGNGADEADARAIVGHETVNMILLGRLLGLAPEVIVGLGQPNHVIYRLRHRWVDHAHLGDDYFDWRPGALQKHSNEVRQLAAGVSQGV